MLDVLDPQLISYGLRLMEKREEAARLFSETFGPLYEQVSGIGDIAVRYIPSWKEACVPLGRERKEIMVPAAAAACASPDAVTAFLEEHREADAAVGLCLSGPHRDRYLFSRGNTEFSGKASTGQRRLLALLLRIAQARRFSDMTGRNPVLLLDDVLLELDPEKRRRLLMVMPEYDQAFYTFLPEEPYERYRKSDTLVYYVNQGSVS
jgi:DNA replication and repair protein RecF